MHISRCGWFGTIPEAILNIKPLVTDPETAVVVPSSDAVMLTLLRHLETRVGPRLSAYEFMSRASMAHTFNHVASLKNPWPEASSPRPLC